MKMLLSKRITYILFTFLLIVSSFFLNIGDTIIVSNAAELVEQKLYSTKWYQPTSTDTSVVYVEFATRVKNAGQISKTEIYYVLSEDSNLTCHIMDEDLNILASSESIYTSAGSGIQSFTIPSYEYSGENLYIALESDKQSIGLGTVQEMTADPDVVTSDNTVSGIQNAQRWSMDCKLSKHNGSTQNGISLYINAYGSNGSFSTASSDVVEIDPMSAINKSPIQESTAECLYTTKYEYPKDKSTTTSYTGFATRVTNIGSISYVEIYYVVTDKCNVFSRLLDTDLNELARSSTVTLNKGVGLQKFSFPSYSYSGQEIYISLESNKKSLALGTVQDNACISSCVTANNTVNGLQNAIIYEPGNPLKKRTGSAQTFTLYIKVYGKRTDVTVSADTKSKYNTDATANVYISNSSGVDKPTAGSQTTPYKTISYAIKQHGNNTIYSLKRGDKFYLQYGLSLSNLNNVVINTYGSSEKPPAICGLISFKPQKKSTNLYTCTLNDKEIGLLFINNSPQWKRKTLDNNLNSKGQYYFDKNSRKLSLYYTSDITSACYATPYTGILIQNCNNLTIDGLSVSFYGRLGIRAGENCSNITISNNTVHDIGGVVLDNNVRYGNGIELWMSNLNNVKVSNNNVYNCFDAGLTAQVSGSETYTNTDLVFNGNTVSSCRYNFEYFNSSSSKSTCKVKVLNNKMRNCIDITGGYREKAETSYGGFFCLWNTNGSNDSVIIDGNDCKSSDAACVAFRDDNYGRIQLNNNKFYEYKTTIVNQKYLHGSNNWF